MQPDAILEKQMVQPDAVCSESAVRCCLKFGVILIQTDAARCRLRELDTRSCNLNLELVLDSTVSSK